MKQKFLVSVITPVYKAEKFIREAVESAVYLDEVGEIILVEDGSHDNSLEECISLKEQYSKVKLITHPDRENKGAGASRNLGIVKAKYWYISFLDADDIYLPNRFERDKELFKQNPSVDVVFNNGGGLNEDWLYYEEKDVERIEKTSKEDLLYNMLKGFILHTNCITIKKSLLTKTGCFNEKLDLHQDTDLWFRLAHFGYLKPGNLKEPVSLTRNHRERRISNRNKQSRKLLNESVLNNFKNYSNVDSRFLKAIIKRYAYNKGSNTFSRFYYLVSLIWSSSLYRKFYLKKK